MNSDVHLISEAYQIIKEQQLAGFVISTPQGDKLEINDDVLFQFGTSEFIPGGEQKLSSLASKIKQLQSKINPNTKIEVVGHTDAYELTPGVNQSLSQQRAQKVQNVLKQNGVLLPSTSKGVGSSQLKVSLPKDPQYQIQGGKAPQAGRRQQQPNRRVELKFDPPLQPEIITQIAPPAQISGPPKQQFTAAQIKMGSFPPLTDEEMKRIIKDFKTPPFGAGSSPRSRVNDLEMYINNTLRAIKDPSIVEDADRYITQNKRLLDAFYRIDPKLTDSIMKKYSFNQKYFEYKNSKRGQ